MKIHLQCYNLRVTSKTKFPEGTSSKVIFSWISLIDFSHFKVFYGLEVEDFNKNIFTLPTHTGDLQNQVS